MFKMFFKIYDNFVIVPLAYNFFLYQSICLNTTRYDKEVVLSDEFVAKLQKEIIEQDDIKSKNIVLNFENIGSINRGFEKYLDNMDVNKIIWVNVKKDSGVQDKLSKINVKGNKLKLQKTKHENGELVDFYVKEATSHIVEIYEYLEKIYNDYIGDIVQTLILSKDKPEYLESSGIYCNCYVGVRKIYENYQHYIYVAYKMADIISSEFYGEDIELDKVPIISTSKTGGILATLVGKLLDKKVIHCLGIGPKYSALIENVKAKIRKGKKYILVADFICLGTEIRILNTILEGEKAELIGGVAVASYVDLHNNEDENTILKNISALVVLKDIGIEYRIAGIKEQIMKGEN